jgi:hypothetical protein
VTAVAVIAGLVVVACVAGFVLDRRDGRRSERPRVVVPPAPRLMIVNVASGSAFRGLGRRDGNEWRLLETVLLDGKGGEQPVDGEVVVAAAAVEFVQLLP